jgi:hypothetical protein
VILPQNSSGVSPPTVRGQTPALDNRLQADPLPANHTQPFELQVIQDFFSRSILSSCTTGETEEENSGILKNNKEEMGREKH